MKTFTSQPPFTIRGTSENGQRSDDPERIDTVVIGGGQAGLSVGYHLAQREHSFVILDASERVGDSWRKRWDSLRLFTPARYDGLDGMPFPADPDYFPTKNEMADYLENYSKHFQLPVRSGMKVDTLTSDGDGYCVRSGDESLIANNVVVAMSNFQLSRIPAFADDLDPAIAQIHGSEYRNPSQLRDGEVLIVGAGNSGAEIAMEVSRSHPSVLAGRSTGEIPFDIAGFAGRHLLVKLVLRGLFHRVLTVKTPIGRKLRPKILSKGGPLIRTKRKHLSQAGVRLANRVIGVQDGLPLLDDGKTLNVANVIWCTGYESGLSWIDLPIHDGQEPNHQGGVVPSHPGLYFVGLEFLYSMSSIMIHGVGRDAERIARLIEKTSVSTVLSAQKKQYG